MQPFDTYCKVFLKFSIHHITPRRCKGLCIKLPTEENNAATVLSTRMKHFNSLVKQRIDKNCWLLKHTKDFIPLKLIQHQTMQLAVKRAEFYQSDCIHEIISTASSDQPPLSKYRKLEDQEPLYKVISTSKVTQDVSEILAPLQNNKDQNLF